jgi:hypothetical protein
LLPVPAEVTPVIRFVIAPAIPAGAACPGDAYGDARYRDNEIFKAPWGNPVAAAVVVGTIVEKMV